MHLTRRRRAGKKKKGIRNFWHNTLTIMDGDLSGYLLYVCVLKMKCADKTTFSTTEMVEIYSEWILIILYTILLSRYTNTHAAIRREFVYHPMYIGIIYRCRLYVHLRYTMIYIPIIVVSIAVLRASK
jgi:hypothetical protein